MPWVAKDGSVLKEETTPSDYKISPLDSMATGASVGGSLGLTRPVLTAVGRATGMPWQEAWKTSGEFINAAKEENPKSYAGGLVGSILLPGGGFSAASKGIKAGLSATKMVRPALAGLAATTAASGLQATGQAVSEDTPESKAADEVLNAMALNVGAHGAGEAIKGGATIVKKGAQRVLGSLQNVSKDAIEIYEKNPRAVKALIADKLGSFAPQIADHTAEQIKNVGAELEKELTDVVSKVKAPVDVSSVISEIENQIQKLERVKVTPDVRSAISTLKQSLSSFYKSSRVTESAVDPYLGTVSKSKDVLSPIEYSASDLLTMKRDLQRAATAVYEGRPTGPINDAFAAIAEKATNSLKDQVPDSAKWLAREQSAIKVKQALGLGGQVDPARVKNILATMSNPDKVQKGFPKIVEEFDAIYGTKLKEASNLFRAASQLGKEDIIAGYGTGRALLGPVIGSLGMGRVGGLLGMILQSPGMARTSISATKSLEKVLKSAGENTPAIVRALEAKKEGN